MKKNPCGRVSVGNSDRPLRYALVDVQKRGYWRYLVATASNRLGAPLHARNAPSPPD
jgi:hypothetical protein